MSIRAKQTVIILLVSLLAQAVFISIIPLRNAAGGGDARIYDNLAVNLAAGKGFTENGTVPAPEHIKYGYIVFLASLYKISGRSILFVNLVQALLVAAACAMAYRIFDELFGRKIGFASAIAAALHPGLLIISSHIITESLFIFLLAAAFFYLVPALKSCSLKKYLPSAIFFGLAAQVRFVAFFLPFFIAAALFLFYSKKKFAFLAGTLMILVMLVACAPWALRNYLVLGHFNPFIGYGGGGAVWLATYTKGNADQDNLLTKKVGYDMTEELKQKYPKDGLASVGLQIERQNMFFKMAVQNILDDPLGYLRLFPIKALRLWTGTYGGLFMIDVPFSAFFKDKGLIAREPLVLLWKLYVFLFSFAVFLFGAIGMALNIRLWRRYFALYLAVAYATLLHMALFANCRMGIPFLPYITVFAVSAIFIITGIERQRCS